MLGSCGPWFGNINPRIACFGGATFYAVTRGRLSSSPNLADNPIALERTFLSYLRTSLALSMIGVTTAQLLYVPHPTLCCLGICSLASHSRLQHVPHPNTTFGFYMIGKSLACTCQGAAIYLLMIGAFRTWRCQNALVRGKAIYGGFEIILLGIGVFLVCISGYYIELLLTNISRYCYCSSSFWLLLI